MALLLGIVGTLSAADHCGYDLANTINPPSSLNLDLPSQIDPRGILTFGLISLALYIIAWLMGGSRQFPRGLSALGYLLAMLLIIIWEYGRVPSFTKSFVVGFKPAFLLMIRVIQFP